MTDLIVSTADQEIKIHKFVLQLFCDLKVLPQLDRLNLEEFSIEIVIRFVNFLYSGKMSGKSE